MSFIALHKTKHSDFCLEVLKTGKGINIAHNNYFLAKEFIEQSHNVDHSKSATQKLNHLKSYLSLKKLKLVHFSIGFDEKLSSYTFQYIVRSKVHNNPDLKIDGYLPNLNNVIFTMFPQMFATVFIEIFDNIPMHILKDVADGK